MSPRRLLPILLGFSGLCLLGAKSLAAPEVVRATSSAGQVEAWAAAAFGGPAADPQGPVTSDDLIRLRNIGTPSVSPDGRNAVFSVRVADMGLNDYRVKWFIVPTDGSAPPRLLTVDGAQPVRQFLGVFLAGYFAPDPARWSPDGRAVALRRQVGDRVQLMVAPINGDPAVAAADGEPQVTRFDWTSASTLTFRLGFNPKVFRQNNDDEVKHGWLVDGRMNFEAAREPSPQIPNCESAVFPDWVSNKACDRRVMNWVANGQTRLATDAEITDLDQAISHSRDLKAVTPMRTGASVDKRADGRLVWTEVADPKHADALIPDLQVRTNAPSLPCAVPACVGQDFGGLGWFNRGKSVWFLKKVSLGADVVRPHRNEDETALFTWDLATGHVQTISRQDRLENCASAEEALVCVQSEPTQPPRLVAINLQTGALRVLADANPEFAHKQFPRIDNVFLHDAWDMQTMARLVYPIHYQAGRRYPLVVVTYRTAHGFQLGGVGDEYPIFPLSGADMFVLNIDKPLNLRSNATHSRDAQAILDRSHNDAARISVDAIETAVTALIDQGLVDPKRVAMTGLSWGSEMTHYALQTSNFFSAAITSSAQQDLTTYAEYSRLTPVAADWLKWYGETNMLPNPNGDLIKLMWSQHPDRLRAPLLINEGADEAMYGFEGIAALQLNHRPVEVRVFPDEGHVKYHPAAYAGIYDNNLMWLKFWLKDEEDPRPQFHDQYLRWEAMRARLGQDRLSDDQAAPGSPSPSEVVAPSIKR